MKGLSKFPGAAVGACSTGAGCGLVGAEAVGDMGAVAIGELLPGLLVRLIGARRDCEGAEDEEQEKREGGADDCVEGDREGGVGHGRTMFSTAATAKRTRRPAQHSRSRGLSAIL